MERFERTHGASVGVSGLEGGSGISIKVGVAIVLLLAGCECLLWVVDVELEYLCRQLC